MITNQIKKQIEKFIFPGSIVFIINSLNIRDLKTFSDTKGELLKSFITNNVRDIEDVLKTIYNEVNIKKYNIKGLVFKQGSKFVLVYNDKPYDLKIVKKDGFFVIEDKLNNKLTKIQYEINLKNARENAFNNQVANLFKTTRFSADETIKFLDVLGSFTKV